MSDTTSIMSYLDLCVSTILCVRYNEYYMSYLDLRVSVPPLFIGLLLSNSRHGVNDVHNEFSVCCTNEGKTDS